MADERTKFKVGDRVRVTVAAPGSPFIGLIGTVKELVGGGYLLDVPPCGDHFANGERLVKLPRPSKGDHNALSFLVREYRLQEFQAWQTAGKASTASIHGKAANSVTGVSGSPSGWEKRLRRLIALGWVMRVRTGWYYILEEGYKVEEGQPF